MADLARASTLPVASADDTLNTLLRAVDDLSLARRVEDVQRVVRTAAQRLLQADGSTFVLRENNGYSYAGDDAVTPPWNGHRLPLEVCIGGWAMLHRRVAVIEDVDADDRVPQDAYRPTFVTSLVMVPIRPMDPLGAIGMYWSKKHSATEHQVGVGRVLADSTAVALEHVQALDKLAHTMRLSETDSLTGLLNRRAWDAVLESALRANPRPLCVALLDLDYFKAYNDDHGRQAGDSLLRRTGQAWRAVLRAGDVVARYGGEEFAVLLPDCDAEHGRRVAERLRRAVPDGEAVSVGLVCAEGSEDAESLIRRADTALSQAKRSGRDRVVLAS